MRPLTTGPLRSERDPTPLYIGDGGQLSVCTTVGSRGRERLCAGSTSLSSWPVFSPGSHVPFRQYGHAGGITWPRSAPRHGVSFAGSENGATSTEIAPELLNWSRGRGFGVVESWTQLGNADRRHLDDRYEASFRVIGFR